MHLPLPSALKDLRPGMAARLFAAVLATAVLVVLLVGGASHWNFNRGFLGYLNDIAVERMAFVGPRLERAYLTHGSWDFLRDRRSVWFNLMRPVPGEDLPADATESASQPPQPPVSDLTGAVLRLGLLDAQNQWVAGYRDLDDEALRRPVVVQGRTVGWLVLAPFQSVADGGAHRFQQAQLHASIAIGAVALLLAAGVAWWVSRTLATPVRRVARATHRLAAGHYDTEVQVNSSDEVGQLAQDFNHLARTLARNEALRREFMADVSHELRTPLAVLQGELEALEDGIRPLDMAAVRSLRAEVGQLGDLVADLYELALSDAGSLSYRLAPLDLAAWLPGALHAQHARLQAAGLTLTLQLPPPDSGPAQVQADAARLQQLLDNLLENARRYTDAPGQVQVLLLPEPDHWHLRVQDSAPGVPEAMMAQLFERFFRVDRARTRATGGAGLGLAICRNLVLAHGGQISAGPSPLGGVCIDVHLPRG